LRFPGAARANRGRAIIGSVAISPYADMAANARFIRAAARKYWIGSRSKFFDCRTGQNSSEASQHHAIWGFTITLAEIA